MAWEYLHTKKFGFRFKIVATYLEDKLGDKIVVDMNCGEIPHMIYYLPTTYKNYYGNDVLGEVIQNGNIEKEILSDHLLLDRLKEKFEKIDILIHIGDGGGKFTGEERESQTSFETFKSIVSYYEPDYVIYEAIKAFEVKYRLVTNTHLFLKEQNYTPEYGIDLLIMPSIGTVSKRLMIFYKRG